MQFLYVAVALYTKLCDKLFMTLKQIYSRGMYLGDQEIVDENSVYTSRKMLYYKLLCFIFHNKTNYCFDVFFVKLIHFTQKISKIHFIFSYYSVIIFKVYLENYWIQFEFYWKNKKISFLCNGYFRKFLLNLCQIVSKFKVIFLRDLFHINYFFR